MDADVEEAGDGEVAVAGTEWAVLKFDGAEEIFWQTPFYHDDSCGGGVSHADIAAFPAGEVEVIGARGFDRFIESIEVVFDDVTTEGVE